MTNYDRMWKDFKQFVDEFKSESDRAAVILAAAKLDLLLYQILQKVLKPAVGRADELLEGDLPLGIFHSRILMCYRLGLIDDHFAKALNLIRKIRNSFAHEPSGASLDSGSHRDRVRELTSLFKNHPALEWTLERYFKDTQTSVEFRAAVALLSARLDGLFDKATTVVYPVPYAIVPPNWPSGNSGESSLAAPSGPAPSGAMS